jgi:hypothetical protein
VLPETRRLDFVSEYLRELAAIDDIRTQGPHSENADSNERLLETIYTGTRMTMASRCSLFGTEDVMPLERATHGTRSH